MVDREKTIVRTSIVGILSNVLLAVMKAVIGLVTRSIAVTMDAVNNLSDVLSSVITLVAAKYASSPPDRKHPFGHGRMEYLAALIVSAIVIYAGITAAVESIKKIITPEKAEYTLTSLVFLFVAILVKIFLGRFFKRQGKKVNSGALTASGVDALYDALLSTSVLLSAIIYVCFGLSLEAYVGLIIAGFIIHTGIRIMKDTLDDVLGKRTDKRLTSSIKDILSSEEGVLGVYDLALYNYGPGKDYASVRIELPDTMKVDSVDQLTHTLERKVYEQTGVVLNGIGVYSRNTSDEVAICMREQIWQTISAHPWALQMHGFYADTKRKSLRFDVVLSFSVDRYEAFQIIQKEVQALYPDYSVLIVPDMDN